MKIIYTILIIGIIVSVGLLLRPTPEQQDLSLIKEQILDVKEQADRIQEIIDEMNNLTLGSTNYVGGGIYRLSGAGVSANATTVILQSFKAPVSDAELIMDNFGSIGYLTLEPGNNDKKEFISFTAVSQDASSDKATLTGITRGLNFVSPYTASTSLQQAHSGGTRVIVSNPPQLYDRLTAKDNTETITAVWSFNSTSMPRLDAYLAPSEDYEFATKLYVDTVATSGASNADWDDAGLVELATTSELSVATNTAFTSDSGAVLVMPLSVFSTSSKGTYGGVLTDASGKLDFSFLDLTSGSWVFTGGATSTDTFGVEGTTTLAGGLYSVTTTIVGSLDISNTTTIAGVLDLTSLATMATGTNPTLQTHLITKYWRDQKAEDTLSTSTIYFTAVESGSKGKSVYATTSGFYFGWCSNAEAYIYMDSAYPGTLGTLYARIEDTDAGDENSFMLPVPKNYWVVATGTSAVCTTWFMPTY